MASRETLEGPRHLVEPAARLAHASRRLAEDLPQRVEKTATAFAGLLLQLAEEIGEPAAPGMALPGLGRKAGALDQAGPATP
jgi:hypothetical protein